MAIEIAPVGGYSRALQRRFQPLAASWPIALGIDDQEHIDAAAELGLGSKDYELVEVGGKD